MKTQCPHCQAKLKASDGVTGKKVNCPKCNQPFVIYPLIIKDNIVEICSTCGEEIGKLEQPCVFKGEIVCAECDKKLRSDLVIEKVQKTEDTYKGVKFKEKEVTDGNTYQVYTAPSQSQALDFLRAKEVRREREYLIVETPEGSFGKDLIMIFHEGSSEKIEFGIRRELPELTKSKTHCTRCGYPVLPAGAGIPGAKELILLDEMKEKGVGFQCCECRTAWCPFCVPSEAPEKCQVCGGPMSISRE
jgi:predicted Zn finger-like uncharacterized protein